MQLDDPIWSTCLRHCRDRIAYRLTLCPSGHPTFLDKGSAFSRSERDAFGIKGYLPYAVHTLEEQVKRAWQQYKSKPDNLAKNTFLTSLRDQNQTLYFALLADHVEEVMPIVYTPT